MTPPPTPQPVDSFEDKAFELCRKIQEEMAMGGIQDWRMLSLLTTALREAARAEREETAQLAERHGRKFEPASLGKWASNDIADQIRARGEKT